MSSGKLLAGIGLAAALGFQEASCFQPTTGALRPGNTISRQGFVCREMLATSSRNCLRRPLALGEKLAGNEQRKGRKPSQGVRPGVVLMSSYSLDDDDDDEYPIGFDSDDTMALMDEDVDATEEFWTQYAKAMLETKGFDDKKTEAGGLELRAGEPLGPEKAKQVIDEALEELRGEFDLIDKRTQKGLSRVLGSFRKHRVGPNMFEPTDGYGHGNIGRDTLDEIFADVFQAEKALVRVQIFSGTHAISCALFAVLRPGDEMLAISGPPYDTLEEVIGTRKEDPDLHENGLTGSLADYGVTYKQVELLDGGKFDYDGIGAALENPKTRLVHIQRSCGYQWRPSILVDEIGECIAWIKAKRPDVVVFVDNCYGEFTEDKEPTAVSSALNIEPWNAFAEDDSNTVGPGFFNTHEQGPDQVGADLIAGSLIKNPGGTLAPSGGYIAGKAKFVKAAFNRLSAPGVDGGATLGWTRNLYQGLFNSPNVVGESLKGTRLVSACLSKLGFETNPPLDRERTDIICAARLGSRENLIAFCKAVQRNSPVGSYMIPEPGMTVGYGDEVIFADGTFIDGSTLELSADGPLREPFVAFCQGGTHWTHWAIVLEEALPLMTCVSKSSTTGSEIAQAQAEAK